MKNADVVVPRSWMEDLHKAIFGRVDDLATYSDVLHRVQWLAAQQDERNAAFLKSQASRPLSPSHPRRHARRKANDTY